MGERKTTVNTGCPFDLNRAPQDGDDIPFDRFSIGDFPFPTHQGALTDADEVLADKHIALLDREFDSEEEMLAALRTLANAFRLPAEGMSFYSSRPGRSFTTVTPEQL